MFILLELVLAGQEESAGRAEAVREGGEAQAQAVSAELRQLVSTGIEELRGYFDTKAPARYLVISFYTNAATLLHFCAMRMAQDMFQYSIQIDSIDLIHVLIQSNHV